ncbi:hypothetical protein JDV02_006693 [Purpureocillium takamizusanense]|uniref:Uncharacterized protein n=1 Tax=Purpureocillium takamizusanense TaxID=2060973 RepID=A0A9Q8QIU8_9HYPO|nr:uncharacterized protein JDV02_006693 [Purpureocillium takamizusanense]UNI20623.1 hypothetical protein JDV02_006693 [Purpureocillium takamizusanense]
MSGNDPPATTAVTGGQLQAPPTAVGGETEHGNSASSNPRVSSMPAADCPPSFSGARHKAKRTSRARLIASLTGADAGGKSAQPSGSTLRASPNLVSTKPDLGKEASNANAPVAVAQDSTPSLVSDSKLPDWQPTPPSSTSQRSASLSLEDQELCAGRSPGRIKPYTEVPKPPETRDFDAAAFDALIYGQPSASRPPPGVFLSQRDKKWHEAKALEIKERGNRKHWFGKVVERRRWLQRVHREKQLARKKRHPGTASDPEPWGYNRVIDFEDVPESKLPVDVLRNRDWLKACAWFRENREGAILSEKHEEAARILQQQRAMGARITNKQTIDFYMALVLSPRHSQDRDEA